MTRYLKIKKSGGWATYTTNKDEATKFAQYTYYGKTYYTVTSGDWDDYYLSYNNRGYLGAFIWDDAVAWGTFDGCLTVEGYTWETFVDDENYVVVDDDKWDDSEGICMKFE